MTFDIIHLESLFSPEIVAFIEKHEEDIESIFPHFDLEEVELGSGYKLMADETIIGLFLYMPKGLEAHIELDYLVEKYQDQGIGKEFFERKIAEFREEGYEEIISLTDHDRHRAYLEMLGFRQSKEHPDRFRLTL